MLTGRGGHRKRLPQTRVISIFNYGKHAIRVFAPGSRFSASMHACIWGVTLTLVLCHCHFAPTFRAIQSDATAVLRELTNAEECSLNVCNFSISSSKITTTMQHRRWLSSCAWNERFHLNRAAFGGKHPKQTAHSNIHIAPLVTRIGSWHTLQIVPGFPCSCVVSPQRVHPLAHSPHLSVARLCSVCDTRTHSRGRRRLLAVDANKCVRCCVRSIVCFVVAAHV